MKNLDRIELIKDRLRLISLLTESKEHFSGVETMRVINSSQISLPYKDYTALRFYLALTCFDILGQPTDWMDFQSWLISSKVKEERETIIDKNSTKKGTEFIKSVYSEYTQIYGVKNSFYRFMREVISDENRKKLFESVSTNIQLTPAIKTSEGVLSPTGRKIILDNTHKEKFLFEIRNSFTHKGISTGIDMAGLNDFDKPNLIPPDWRPIWMYIPILKKEINGDIIWFNVRRWPFVLTEIIEDTINTR